MAYQDVGGGWFLAAYRQTVQTSIMASHRQGGWEPVGSQASLLPRVLLRVVVCVPLALVYAVPFLGLVLSMALPALTHACRGFLWGAASRSESLVGSVLAWVGLWLPALTYFFTGWTAAAPAEQSTSWLIIPLCGPIGPWTTLAPAAAATAVGLIGLAVAHRLGRPWPWVISTWLAPWMHQYVLRLLPNSEFIC